MMRRAARVLALIVPILLAGGPVEARKRDRPAPGWQQIALPEDRDRLRGWRDTWLEGLRQARAGGAGKQIDAAGPLLDPDAAQGELALPDGAYRCRTIKLGAFGGKGAAFVAWPAQPCRIAGGRFAVLGGMQRPAGALMDYDASRLVFLGSLAVGDDMRALGYGRDRVRDMIGLVERVGPRRWRLVLPSPRWESLIDVIEIVPAG